MAVESVPESIFSSICVFFLFFFARKKEFVVYYGI